MLGVFVARDIILFYVFFEFTLIPLFFLIGIWGSEERRYAAIKFFLFTLAGSVLTFLGLLAIVLWDYFHSPAGRHDVLDPDADRRPGELHPIGCRLAAGLDLPGACSPVLRSRCRCSRCTPGCRWPTSQAPTAGSVLLAGVLLKIGTYGFLRFSLPMLPAGRRPRCMPWLLWLSVAGIVYGALVALAQSDIKRLIAYSSVSHLGFCMLGLFALNRLGTAGRRAADDQPRAVDRRAVRPGRHALRALPHPRRSPTSAAWPGRLPVLAFFMLVLTLSSIGLPGLNGFAGEFLLLLGHVPAGLGRAPPAGLGRAVPRDRRAGRQRRGAGRLVHAVAGPAGLLRPGHLREPAVEHGRARRRSATCRAGRSWPWCRCGVHRLDRRLQPGFFLDPHGAHARRR